MRMLPGLALLFFGCQLLPQTEVSCANSDRCAGDMTGPSGPPPDTVQAPFVLGQPDEQTNWLVHGMFQPQGVVFVGSKLLVSDTMNNRVLIWNTLPTANGQAADAVLGQDQVSTQLTSNFYDPTTALFYPTRMTSDGTNLIVACDGPTANRLIFYKQFPSKSNAHSDFFIDPTTSPSAAGPQNFKGASPLLAGGHLYVGDRGFNRLLMWDAVPTGVTNANRAIGQMDLTGGAPNPNGVGAGSFNGPEGAPSSDGTKLYVADTKNNRVLVWNTLPTTNTAAAMVLGQADATSNTANRTNAAAVSMNTLYEPVGLSVSGTRLAVADRRNNRVLLWNQQPTTTGQSADIVLGQTSGTGQNANQGGLSGAVLNQPNGVATDGTHVAVADTTNNRVLIWNSWPVNNGQPADLVLGQPALNKNLSNARLASVNRYIYPTAVARAGNQLLAVDRDAHRVLIWSRLPTAASEDPVLVLGQMDFAGRSSNAGGGVSAIGMDTPHGVSSDGNIVAVADTNNNRILLWKSIPTSNQQPAELVIGQPDLTNDQFNNGGPEKGLDTPYSVFVRGGRIYVADAENDRVLIWKAIPTSNHQAADIVLGQADFSGIGSNRGGPVSSAGLSRPMFAYADDAHIYVSDSNNARVLVWNTLDPVNGQAANLVLGQDDFSNGAHSLTPNAQTIGSPAGLDVFKGVVYISDSENSRVAVFSSTLSTFGQPASALIGQTSFGSSSANAGGLSQSSLQAPSGVLVTEIGIYVADSANSRILVLPPPQ